MNIETVRTIKAEIRDAIKEDPEMRGIGITRDKNISVRLATQDALDRVRNRFGTTYKGCIILYEVRPEEVTRR